MIVHARGPHGIICMPTTQQVRMCIRGGMGGPHASLPPTLHGPSLSGRRA